MMKKEKTKLTGVPETMLIPPTARYVNARRKNVIISDPKTIEILARIEYDFSGKKEVSVGSRIGVAIRTEILDEETNRFLSKNPDTVVVNLGCGLDTRFERLDNGTARWFELTADEVPEIDNIVTVTAPGFGAASAVNAMASTSIRS